MTLHFSLLSKQKIPNKQFSFLHVLVHVPWLPDLVLQLSPPSLSSHPDQGAGFVVVVVVVVVGVNPPQMTPAPSSDAQAIIRQFYSKCRNKIFFLK